MPEYDAQTAIQNRWRNPIFLGIFVPGAVAWLTVVGWVVWVYFNPVMDWVGRQHEMLQEIFGLIIWGGAAVIVVVGLAAVALLAERVAGLPPANATGPGQTAGKHSGWTPPKRS